jgi:hypothetical protein
VFFPFWATLLRSHRGSSVQRSHRRRCEHGYSQGRRHRRGYTIGPTIQLALPLRLRVEVDARYRPIGIDVTNTATYPNVVNTPNTSGSQWRVPILLQYRLATPIVKPFVEAGYFLRTSRNSSKEFDAHFIRHCHYNAFRLTQRLRTRSRTRLQSPVFTGDKPELRYTRQPDLGSGSLLTNSEAEFLISIRF